MKRKPTERLSADELAEIHELEWAIACLNYDIVRLQCRDEFIAGQESAPIESKAHHGSETRQSKLG